MKIIMGIGNPGHEYEKTWHNLGSLVLDRIRSFWDFPSWKKEEKNEALVSSGKIGKEKILLTKPLTFMNRSGDAASKLLAYYKSRPADLTVIHDEFDLPWGTARRAFGRGSAGHQGVQSIIDALGTKNFTRIRLGIFKNDRQTKALDYVLKKITKKENAELEKMATEAEAIIKENIITFKIK